MQRLQKKVNHIATTRLFNERDRMKIELTNKEFKLKETQFRYDHSKGRLSDSDFLGVAGQKVILIDIWDDLAIVNNKDGSINYYTLYSNLE